MEILPEQGNELSRRELMKRGLRAGAYAAPVVLAAAVVAPVAAQALVSAPTMVPLPTSTSVPLPTSTPVPLPTMVPAVLCAQPVTYLQDFVLTGAAPLATYNVFFRPSNVATFPASPATTVTTDAQGVGVVTFPVTVDTSVVTSVTIVVTIPGFPASTPTNPASTPFVSNIVTVLACTNGGTRAPGNLVSAVFQEPTVCSGVAQIASNYLDVGIFNATPSTSYDVYIQPNSAGAFTLARAGIVTNSQGNVTVIVPFAATATPATSFNVVAVLAGSPASAVVLTRGAVVVNIACPLFSALPNVHSYTNLKVYGLHA